MEIKQEARLFLISFLLLFAEMTVIRWVPSLVRMVAYFTNTMLISAFLGMGIGAAMYGRRKDMRHHFSTLLAVFVFFVVVILSGTVLPLSSKEDYLWNGLSSFMHSHPAVNYVILVLFFALNTMVFVPLGQILGEQMQGLDPLKAYSINVAGSLAGIAAFSAVSILRLQPTAWFLMILLAYSAFRRMDFNYMSTAVLILVTIYSIDLYSGAVWSPYYMINYQPFSEGANRGYDILVNQESHQAAVNLSSGIPDSPAIRSRRELYELPYRFNNPRKVLIVGAGTGNDVAAALRSGVSQVDAVEIDPVILELGGKLHPENPYADQQVKPHVDDARAFIKKSGDKYDVIAYGFLDSHTLFSSMSNIRLDNYIYTIESFREAKSLLSDNGVIAVTFTVHEKWIADKIYALGHSVFKQTPIVYQGDSNAWGTVFIFGPGTGSWDVPSGSWINDSFYSALRDNSAREYTWPYINGVGGFVKNELFSEKVDLTTDDWPYLYMQGRFIPPNYTAVLAIVLAVSILMTFLLVPNAYGLDKHFFLLGAGFMLLETKSITTLALLFGSTWIINSIVFSTILVMILAANAYIQRRPPKNISLVYGLLVASLVFNFFFPLDVLNALGLWARLAAASVIVFMPLFFAAIVFATSFRNVNTVGIALGSNMIGVVLGGLLEYSSLQFGLRWLYLLAIAIYLLSMAA